MTNPDYLKQSLSWEEDYRDRVHPALMTGLMHQCVPALKAMNWRVTVVEPGYAETVLPLSPAATNQHGTHQGALISLSADYTGGMAMVTLLRGVPLAGIHRCSLKEAASVWLASMNVKFKAPSTGHLTGRCRIPEPERSRIVSRYSEGKRVLVTLPVEFESNGQIVAEAEMTYFAQPAIQLLEAALGTPTLFHQKIKASARLIAGIRAKAAPWGTRAGDSYSGIAAGPQGEMLAEKLARALPQLVQMVQARTRHGDQMIRSVKGLRQVVLAGAGLDMRPFQFKDKQPQPVFFEVDLPEMLIERDRIGALILDSQDARRVSVPCDFLKDGIESELSKHGFDPALPTAILYEGCSMYFERAVNEKMLRSFSKMMGNPKSRLWVDFVAESVITGETAIPEVRAFLRGMEDLGESFIFGCDQPEEFVAGCGLQSLDTATARQVVRIGGQSSMDPVLDRYGFTVAQRR